MHTFIDEFLPAIEDEMHRAIDSSGGAGMDEFRHMLAYHLGWEGEGAGAASSGKRIRPQLVLLSAAAAGAEWRCALPAAAAVELVHNFSLIHDDIEDNSPLRHGRPTVWAVWGVPLAINAGDAMFTLAHITLLRLRETTTPAITLQALQVLHETCLRLTQGQYLDISYEARGDLNIDAYWPMIGGKTAALLSACTELGALSAGAGEATRDAYRRFGRSLGLAFQAQDDLLGIWGDAALTGKPAESDLVSGKKSLPVLYGLSQAGEFAARWENGPITAEEVPALAQMLEREGARGYTGQRAAGLTAEALQALEEAGPQGVAGQALKALALKLLGRDR